MAAPNDRPEGPLKSILTGWDQFWFTPQSPTTSAVVRIFGGLLTFYVLLTYSWDLLGYVGPDGWLDDEMATFVREKVEFWRQGLSWDDGWEKHESGNYYWSVYYHVRSTGWIIAIHAFFLACALLYTAGLWTTFTGLLTYVAAMSYCERAVTTVFGLDTMMIIVLTYLQIAPGGAVLSLDRWLEERRAKQRGEPPPPVVPSYRANFAMRLMQFHFAFIYLASGTSKLLGTTWWSGTSLNLVILNPAFAPMDWPPYYHLMRALALNRWVWEVAVSGSIVFTLALEISFIFLVWDMRWRWFMLTAAVMLHVGIGVLMNLTTFSLMMLVMLLSFVPPKEFEVLLPKLHAGWRKLFSGKEPAARERELAGVR
jgi:hypothetical protein